MTSSTGPSGIGLLAGKFIVVGVNRGEQSVAKVDAAGTVPPLLRHYRVEWVYYLRDQGEGPLNGRFLQKLANLSAFQHKGTSGPPFLRTNP